MLHTGAVRLLPAIDSLVASCAVRSAATSLAMHRGSIIHDPTYASSARRAEQLLLHLPIGINVHQLLSIISCAETVPASYADSRSGPLILRRFGALYLRPGWR